MMNTVTSIVAAAKEISKNDSCYYEQDTIERIILPTLVEVFGSELLDVREKRLVRDNRINSGCKQVSDLNLYDNGRLACGVECKCIRDGFLATKKIASRGYWEPEFGDANRNKLFDQVFTEGRTEGLNRIEKYFMLGGMNPATAVQVLASLWRRGIRKPDDCSDDEERRYLTRLCSFQSNPTVDYLGQVWRYCQDGLHQFDKNYSVAVWTNGREWVVFNRSFYNDVQWPRIIVDHRTRHFSASPHFFYCTLSEMDRYEEDEWKMGIEKLKDYLLTILKKEGRNENAKHQI